MPLGEKKKNKGTQLSSMLKAILLKLKQIKCMHLQDIMQNNVT